MSYCHIFLETILGVSGMKKKVIVWGTGKNYEMQKRYIEDEFQIVGYIDKKMSESIKVENLSMYEFDYIYISTSKYETEIRGQLKNVGIDDERIVTIRDMYWKTVPNSEIRDKWIEEKLKNISDGKIILDAGAGEQPYKKFCSHLKYISQDFGEYDDSEKKEALQMQEWNSKSVDILSDIIDIPLENESVDIILCTEVIEHLKNPILAIKEFSRLLKLGGQLLLTAPNCSLTHMAPYYFYNGFSRYWYKENLKDFGFEIEELTEYGNYFSWIKQELLRTEEIMERYVGSVRGEGTCILNAGIKFFDELAKLDKGSSELLCLGRLVVAKKVLK